MNYTASTPEKSSGDIFSAIQEALGRLPKEPFADWMISHLADPATHVLFLPESYRVGIPYRTPNYVKFSKFVIAPTLVRRATTGELLDNIRNLRA